MYVRVCVSALVMPMRSMTIQPEVVVFMTACRSSWCLITLAPVKPSWSGSSGKPTMENESQ